MHDRLADEVRESVCHTPSTPVTIGIATIPATSDDQQVHVDGRLAARVDLDRGVEDVAQQERRDDAEPAESTIRPQVSASRRLYGLNSRTIRRRFAFRTAGSDGRSGSSPLVEGFPSASGHGSSVPAAARASRHASRRARSTAARIRAVSSRVAGIVGEARSTTIGSPTTTRTRASRGSRVPGRRARTLPTIATGTSGAPVVSASRAAPRCHGRSAEPSTVPWGKIATAAPASRARATAATAATSPRRRSTGIPPSASRTRPTSRFHQSSLFVRKRSGRSIEAPRKNGSESESWFATTITGPAGTARLPPPRAARPAAAPAPGPRGRAVGRHLSRRPWARPDHTRSLLRAPGITLGRAVNGSPASSERWSATSPPSPRADVRVGGAGRDEHVVEAGSWHPSRTIVAHTRQRSGPTMRWPRRRAAGKPPRIRRDRSSRG